jgi:cell division protein FtsA
MERKLADAENYVVGLDIGTTKVAAVIAVFSEDKEFSVIGVGSSRHTGLRKGNIINLEETVRAIREAVGSARMQAGVEVDDVIVGISGEYIESSNSSGVVSITGKDKEVTRDDVKRVIEAARNIRRPQDRKVLHVIPQQFIVDDQDGITEPLGMSGFRLESVVHIVTSLQSPMVNIVRSVEKAGYRVRKVVMEQLASSYAVLHPDEKELGVCLIDIGGGSSDIAMFYDRTIHFSAVVPWGGQSITNDIAAGLRIPIEKAEKIKITYGDAMMERNYTRDEIEIEGIGGRPSRKISASLLGEIIVPRVTEIFELSLEKIQESDIMDLMRAGIVLTGGTSLLPGIREVAEKVFGMPVKIGLPMGIKGLQDDVSNPASIMVLMAFPPAPPTPMTLMDAF